MAGDRRKPVANCSSLLPDWAIHQKKGRLVPTINDNTTVIGSIQVCQLGAQTLVGMDVVNNTVNVTVTTALKIHHRWRRGPKLRI
jgi:hypothetical protein